MSADAEPLTDAQLEGVRAALRFYNPVSLIPRLVATIDALLERLEALPGAYEPEEVD